MDVRLAHFESQMLLCGCHLRVNLLFRRAFACQLRALGQRQNIDADLNACHPAVSAGAIERRSIFLPVSICAHTRAEVGLSRSYRGGLCGLSLSQRHQVGTRLLGSRYLFFQHALRKRMRLNRFQLSCFQVRCAHRFTQSGPGQFEVSLRRDQLLFARGYIDLRRHSIRLDSKTRLHVLVHRTLAAPPPSLARAGRLQSPAAHKEPAGSLLQRGTRFAGRLP